MKRILFGLFLYCVSSISAQAVLYYAWKYSGAQANPAFFNELDADSLSRGENPALGAVVLLLGKNNHGTGILIQPPAGHEDLRGRLVLTAAHVIVDNEGEIRVHPTGLTAVHDDEGLIEKSELIEPIRVIPHKGFTKDNESTRQHDYGLIILEKPIEGEGLRLLEPASIDLDTLLGPPIEIVGFGDRLCLSEGGHQKSEGMFKRRIFESIIEERDGNVLVLNSEKFLSPRAKEVFTFPFSGDSGGPIFAKENYSQVLGVVSGIEGGIFKYVHVTNEDVGKLLSSPGK